MRLMNERIVAHVAHGRPAHRVATLVVLEQDLDERTRLEVRTAKPLVEHIKNREQLVGGCPPAAFDLALQPGARPPLLTIAKESER